MYVCMRMCLCMYPCIHVCACEHKCLCAHTSHFFGQPFRFQVLVEAPSENLVKKGIAVVLIVLTHNFFGKSDANRGESIFLIRSV